MAAEWQSIRIRDLGKVVTGRTPPGTHPDYFGDQMPFLTPTDMDGRRLAGRTARSLSKAGVDLLRQIVVPHGVAVSCIGWQMGKAVLVDRPVATNQQINSVIPDRAVVEDLFLYYSLTARREEIFRLGAGGSRTPILNKSGFENISVEVPPLAEQRSIARHLGALDDKIELNRRTNETLEGIARALFRSWFVDFDPVRAKSESRDPGLPQPLGDLFPESFAVSESGEIPRGWRPSTVGKEVATVLGGTPSRSVPSYWAGDIPWINSGKANEFRITEPSEYITREGLASSATKMLPSRTTAIAITGATLGQVSLTEIETCANQSVVGVLGTSSLPSEFLYFWVKERIHELLVAQTGGAQQHINKSDVNDLRVVCPSEAVIGAYLALVRPMFDRIRSGCMEVRTLAELRDRLLPELMSGQIRVTGPERFIGRAIQ